MAGKTSKIGIITLLIGAILLALFSYFYPKVDIAEVVTFIVIISTILAFFIVSVFSGPNKNKEHKSDER